MRFPSPFAVRVALLASVVQLASTAMAVDGFAASINGTITDVSGVALQSMQVRLWLPDDDKAWTLVRSVGTDAAGSYAFTGVPAGTYRVNARGNVALNQNYADRWFDVEEPSASGWLSAAVENMLDFLAGMVVLRSMSLVKMPPSVSMPSESGVTSSSNTPSKPSSLFSTPP